MNTEYIRSLLNVFHNHSIYDIETALIIYEFSDKEKEWLREFERDKDVEIHGKG